MGSMTGRPTIYNEQKVQRVLDLVAGGASLREACRRVRIKPGTFSSWVVRDYHGLGPQFYAALRAKYLVELDQTVELADSVLGSNSLPEVVAAKNAADARRFIAGRIIREFHNTEHLQVDHRHRTRIIVYLPRKESTEPRGQMIEGTPPQVIEDQSADPCGTSATRRGNPQES